MMLKLLFTVDFDFFFCFKCSLHGKLLKSVEFVCIKGKINVYVVSHQNDRETNIYN